MATANSNARKKRRESMLESDRNRTKFDFEGREQNVSGINSSARARRRIKNSQTDSSLVLGAATSGIQGIDYELMREIESYVSERSRSNSDPKTAHSQLKQLSETSVMDGADVDGNKPNKSRFDQNKDFLDGSESLTERKDDNDLIKSTSDSLNPSGNGRSLRKGSSQPLNNSSENFNCVKVLATLLPDEILYKSDSRGPYFIEVACLFADVSGFTELCEKFDKTGKGGPSRLTEILNSHIGSMIQLVLNTNGDVCKFGGDAILCFWKTTPERDIRQSVNLAVDSALNIQKKKINVGVQIRVKIAISAGEACFSVIGPKKRKYFVLVGQPVLDTNYAEKICLPGEIILAPSAWKHISNLTNYDYAYHEDKTHITIQDYNPMLSHAKSTGHLSSNSEGGRPALKMIASLKIEDLRPFILPFVMKCIDNNEPLVYLTEMRQVAIVFIRIVVQESTVSPEEIVETCNVCFEVICDIVDKADGTVNKLTCFDKDCSVLIVFGLRGFKHQLASKTALKCAYDCLEKLRRYSFGTISAGVTTGMAYCGVVGDLLRREYTVMGLPVNKAARLMCAYPNIVSCDRETFLQSKLKSAHFDVLQQKSLKGIHNIGPIYEFSLAVKRNRVAVDLDSQPLLGRYKEVAEFEKFLVNYTKTDVPINFFVIYGGARIGKSRLLTKLIRIAEKFLSQYAWDSKLTEYETKGMRDLSNVDICFIPLSEDDYKSVYSTVRLIFQQPLGLNESSSVEEKEEKILSKLGDMKDLYFLASLNPIFNVKFSMQTNYMKMSQEERFIAKRLLKKRLYFNCFPKHSKWLIVIEDAEFIDESSWIFLRWCSSVASNPLFMLTVGQQKALSPSASECLLSIPQKKVVLMELDKWFYTALACQILEVKAIPVQLENLLQGQKNSGNPGWLESYLLSLLQTDCIQVTYVPKQAMDNMKLVTAPVEMLPGLKATGSESPHWFDWVEQFRVDSLAESDIIPVCVLGPNFVGTGDNSQLTMDIMFVKTLDKLKPLEQLILKAASVLGYSFKRDALRYLISQDLNFEERTLAKAIKNLFEIRILCCAKGDFTCPSSLVMNRRVILNNVFQKDIKCECIGLTTSGIGQNLPNYAMCGYMRFRSNSFKETVYNLLLDEQKKRFHLFSIEFLRTNTYKCKSCRSVLFDRVFGKEVDGKLELVCSVTPMHGIRSTQLIMGKRADSLKTTPAQKRDSERSGTIASRSGGSIGGGDASSFSTLDFGDCQCPQILCSVFTALLDHAEGAGRKDIMLEVNLEFASVALTSANIPLTTEVLENTLALVKVIQEEKEYPQLCTPFIFGKIFILMGATKLSMGRPDQSLELLETALKYLGKKIPKNTIQTKLQGFNIGVRRKIIAECFPNVYIGKASDKKAALMDLISECLGFMCMVYMYEKNWRLAKFTSIWALNNALRSFRNFFGLCTAYANMMDVAYHINYRVHSSRTETYAINVCENSSKQTLEIYELEAMARLYKIVFRTRHKRADVEGAIIIGFRSIRIASIVRNSNLRLELMPEMILALIMLNRLSEAVSLLQELEFTSAQYCDKAGRTWYYGLCMNFQLDTGYTIIPYKTCEKFFNEEEEQFNVAGKGLATELLCTSMWLWCIRHGEWEASNKYAKLIRPQSVLDDTKSPILVSTRLKRLEGLLITLAHKSEKRNIYTSTTLDTEIIAFMKVYHKDMKYVRISKARFLLFKAYYNAIKNKKVSNLLRRARRSAAKMKDRNTMEWIAHNKTVWKNMASIMQRNFWVDHCKFEDFIDWHEADSREGRDALQYSLPLP